MITQIEAREYLVTLMMHFPHKLSEREDGFVRNCRSTQGDLTPKQLAAIDRVMSRCAA